MKLLSIAFILTCVSTQVACTARVAPQTRTPGLVTYNEVAAKSVSKPTASEAAVSAASANKPPTEESIKVETAARADGKGAVVVADEPVEDDPSFSNEDVSEELNKSGRVAFRRGQDWE